MIIGRLWPVVGESPAHPDGNGMSEYVLDHHREGERDRLDLMSRLLDPMHRRHIEQLGVGPGARTLEVGCGNGSISAWLAERVATGGRAVAVDLDLSLVDADMPGLELRQADIVAGPVEPRDFDLVTARAVLHHVARLQAAVANLVASLRPGGAILLIEPDFLPVSVAEPPAVRAFWDGWLAWSRDQGLDADGGRAARRARRLREARRPAHRPVSRPVRRSTLVDPDDRVHGRAGPGSRRLRNAFLGCGRGRAVTRSPSATRQPPNQRLRRLAPNSAFAAAYSREGSLRSATGASPPRKLISTLLTSPSPNSA